MDVQSPTTGRRFYKIDDAIGQILCDAGIVFPLRAAPALLQETPACVAPPKADEFSIVVVGNGKPVIQLRRPSGEFVRFGEHPSIAEKSFAAINVKVPQEILDRYSKSWPQDTDAVMAARREQITKGTAAQQKQGAGQGW